MQYAPENGNTERAESLEHGGQAVARTPDGNLYAESYEELYALIRKESIAPHDVRIEFVAPADESLIF